MLNATLFSITEEKEHISDCWIFLCFEMKEMNIEYYIENCVEIELNGDEKCMKAILKPVQIHWIHVIFSNCSISCNRNFLTRFSLYFCLFALFCVWTGWLIFSHSCDTTICLATFSRNRFVLKLAETEKKKTNPKSSEFTIFIVIELNQNNWKAKKFSFSLLMIQWNVSYKFNKLMEDTRSV